MAQVIEVTLTPDSPNHPAPGTVGFKINAFVHRGVSFYASDEGGSYVIFRDAPVPFAGNPNPPEISKVFEIVETPYQLRLAIG